MEWTLPKAQIFRQRGLLASAQLSPSSSQGLQIFSKTFLCSKFWCDGICLWNGEVGLHSPSGWDVVCTCQEGSARSQSCPESAPARSVLKFKDTQIRIWMSARLEVRIWAPPVDWIIWRCWHPITFTLEIFIADFTMISQGTELSSWQLS